MRHLFLTPAIAVLATGLTLHGIPVVAGGDSVGPGPVFTPTFVPPVQQTIPTAVPSAIVLDLPQVATPQATTVLVQEINNASQFCNSIGAAAYVVDCLGERLSAIEQAMPETGEYAEARDAIAQATRGLRMLVDENASPDLPDGVARSSGPDATATSRPLRAVSTENIAETLAAAANIIEQAETVLLRSTATPARNDYQRIAEAVGSNKVLLRSL